MTQRLPLLLCVLTLLAACSPSKPTSVLIHNATIMDGSGAPAFAGALRFDGDRIVDVGELTALPNERQVDAGGMLLAPGFIDTHSHHDGDMAAYPEMIAVVSQGITTIVRGADGYSELSEFGPYTSQQEFEAQFNARPVAINIASFSPHNSIRLAVMGDDFRRAASEDEIAEMAALLESDMRHGALGMATGLEYEPGIYSETHELIELAKVAAGLGGRYSGHIRDEDDRFLDAVDETIRISREARIPAHISHIKLADKKYWGTTDAVFEKLDAARDEGLDISADIYAYIHWQSVLAVLFPDRDYTNADVAEFTFERTTAPETLILSDYAPNPEFKGMSVAEISRILEQSPVETLLHLAQTSNAYSEEHGEGGDSIIAKGMSEDDVARFMAWPYANICTDGGHTGGHPRGYGSFPRFFARYAERAGLSQEAAIAKMSSMAARNVGIAGRGSIKPGYFADLVLLDPGEYSDNATFENPELVSSGVLSVWVNGVVVFQDGETTGNLPGRPVGRLVGSNAEEYAADD